MVIIFNVCIPSMGFVFDLSQHFTNLAHEEITKYVQNVCLIYSDPNGAGQVELYATWLQISRIGTKYHIRIYIFIIVLFRAKGNMEQRTK